MTEYRPKGVSPPGTFHDHNSGLQSWWAHTPKSHETGLSKRLLLTATGISSSLQVQVPVRERPQWTDVQRGLALVRVPGEAAPHVGLFEG
jgi:hypothetical protein